jgi:RNA polymerase sigma factor (sigma-70 family)
VEAEGNDVALAQNGDAAAFERLYRAHVAKIHSLANRMAGDQAAEDLTQEVFILSWQKLSSFRKESAFGTWLHRLAVNLILTRRETLRKQASRETSSGDVLAALSGRSSVPGLRLDFEKAIGGLPDRVREVFVLYDVEGFKHDEIAIRLGISTGTSKSQLHRARMMMRSYLL